MYKIITMHGPMNIKQTVLVALYLYTNRIVLFTVEITGEVLLFLFLSCMYTENHTVVVTSCYNYT